MAAAVWSGSIVLSLISIPIKLYAAARAQRTYLHQIHKECNSRVRQPLFCPTCNRAVDRGEVVKGYEFDEGQYVLVEEKEVKKLAAVSSHTLEIVAFSKQAEIDPIFFDSSYFCIPEDNGQKAYQVLTKALEDTKTVGIGKLLMHQRDYTVFLRPYQQGLVLHTMYFSNEIRELPQFGVLEAVNVKSQELKLAEQLISQLTEPFQPKQYHNEFQERLQKLIAAKQQGKSIEIGSEPKRAPVVDLMTALKKSLATGPSASRNSREKSQAIEKPKKLSAARRAS
ncbi:MAG TPA: Ku protein [Candidatus Saccharimonadales bacterium]|nr:Ku protein [Candidatus Saccharimonadales bacterium]